MTHSRIRNAIWHYLAGGGTDSGTAFASTGERSSPIIGLYDANRQDAVWRDSNKRW